MKDLNLIDKLTDDLKVTERNEIKKIREMQRVKEQQVLQKRIQSFCSDLEELKLKSKTNEVDSDSRFAHRPLSFSS